MRIAIAVLAVSLLVSCAVTPPPAPKDPFFELEVVPPETSTEPDARESSKASSGTTQILLEFTLLQEDSTLRAPSVVVEDAVTAEVSVVNELSFVADFDLETAEDAWIADPIIGVLATGLRLEVTPSIRRDGAINLLYRIMLTDAEQPVRQITTPVGDGSREPVTIQLPALNLVELAGNARIPPGVETVLARFPAYSAEGVRPVRVVVQATPLGGQDAPGLSYVSRERNLEVRLVRMPDIDPEQVRHLDREAGDLLLERDGAEVLKSFRLRTDAATGVEVKALRQVSYLQDFDVEVSSTAHVNDPIVGTLAEGFTGTLAEGFTGTVSREEYPPVFHWSFDRLVEMGTFTTTLGMEMTVMIEVPELIQWSGDLPLTAPINVVGIARLADGGTVAVVVMMP